MGQRNRYFYGEQGHYEIHMTCILHITRINNVESLMFAKRIRMAVFTIESLWHSRASECRIWSSKVLFLKGTENFEKFVPHWGLDKNIIIILLLPSKFTNFLILFTNMTHLTLLIQAACRRYVIYKLHFNIKSLRLSGRTKEYRIWRSEVQFQMGTQNFFLVPGSWQEKRCLTLFLYPAPSVCNKMWRKWLHQ